MIVPSMNLNEVYEEMCADFEGVMRHSFVHGRLMQKELIRKGLGHQTIHIKHQTKSRNDWNILIRIFPHLVVNKPYLISEDKYGKVVYLLEMRDNYEVGMLIKYNTHFFTRYRERQPVTGTGAAELIKTFFKQNWDHQPGVRKTAEEDVYLFEVVYPQGIGLGWAEVDKNCITMKTYLPNHLLNDKQKSNADLIRGTDDAGEFSKMKLMEYKLGLYLPPKSPTEF